MFLFAWLGFVAGANSKERERVQDAQALLSKREHFYLVIAGRSPGAEPGPANRLARDLRDLPVEDVSTFTGDSNRYGGITSELGFDPFDGVDCSECGRLDGDVVYDTVEIKNGNIDTILSNHEAHIEPADTRPSPGGYIFFLWVLALPAYAGVVYVMQSRHTEETYKEFSRERTLIRELREAQEHDIPDYERKRLQLLADALEGQIETRVSYSKTKTQKMEIEQLAGEAETALDAITVGNETLN